MGDVGWGVSVASAAGAPLSDHCRALTTSQHPLPGGVVEVGDRGMPRRRLPYRGNDVHGVSFLSTPQTVVPRRAPIAGPQCEAQRQVITGVTVTFLGHVGVCVVVGGESVADRCRDVWKRLS